MTAVVSPRRVATPELPGAGINMANTYTSLHYHIIFSTKGRDMTSGMSGGEAVIQASLRDAMG
jgi:hypothetical protein